MVAGLALVAGACGDDVTVAAPVVPTPVVTSVTVAPSTATLTVGQTINMTAAVNADASLATTVTWTSSNTAAVTVGSTTGVVTAVAATPGVAVCAASTVDTGKRGCATIVVQAAAPTLPASVSIASVTTNTGGLNAPVVATNVSGQVDVRVNVNPGNQTVSKVVLLLGTARVDSQTFTAAQAAQLRFDADQAVANQTTFPQQLFSVNTAFYNAAGTGAITPQFLNGNAAFQVLLFTTQAGATNPAASATDAPLTLNNLDGFHVAVSGGSTANDATGYRWRGNGGMIINARPVMYSGRAVGAINTNFVNSGTCASAVLGAAVNQLAAATTATNFTDTLALAGYAFNQVAANCATAVQYPAISATDANGVVMGNLVTNGVLNSPSNTASWNADQNLGLRWDNVAPAGVLPTFVTNPNNRTGGWINDAVTFNAISTGATSNNWLNAATAPVDAGVGGAVNVVAAATATTTTAALASTTFITSAATLARSANATTYCAVASARDALGNTASGAVTATACAANTSSIAFGVDRDAPVAAYAAAGAGQMAANFLSTAGLTGYRVTHFDTGLVGNSGFIGSTAASRSTVAVSRRNANNAATTFTPNASSVVSIANVADTLVVDVSNATTSAYYTTTITLRDNAGNTVTVGPRVALFDNVVPQLLVPTQANVALTGGVSQSFTSTGTDDNDLASVTATLPYNPTNSTAAPFVFQVANTTLNTYNVSPAVVSSTITATVPFFVRGMMTVGAAADSATINGIVAPGTMTMTLNGMAGNTAAQNYTLQNVAAATAFTGVQITKLWVSGAGSISNGTGTSANPTSRTFVLNHNGPIAAPLFTRVELFRFDATVGAYRSAGVTTSASAVIDNGAVRTTQYSVSFTPGTAWGSGAQNMLMVAYNANGDAVTIFTPLSVTITNP
ncbi:MAG: Ig-like domain-containing protein [Gemmatimonadaceae bacterium]|nr:Ig-like domain-containing protein [Gemmatimonadaceae bacterium]